MGVEGSEKFQVTTYNGWDERSIHDWIEDIVFQLEIGSFQFVEN